MEMPQINYGQWLEEWLSAKKGFVKEATWANYTVAVMNHILPALGAYRLEELTEDQIGRAHV